MVYSDNERTFSEAQMKSVCGTIMIFIGLYILAASGILGFLAQRGFVIFAVSSVIVMLIIALITLGIPGKKKRGRNENETKRSD